MSGTIIQLNEGATKSLAVSLRWDELYPLGEAKAVCAGSAALNLSDRS